ncbi:hypothetical protein [Vulgatibacter sp.]|uniref:hypothetical protein n=1 Tax=Vulgatibacter sp. TaxID=1971226 RepID=UPI003564842A
MASRSWLALVVELYLPPDPAGTEVERVARDAFRPLLRLLDRHRGAGVTVALDPGLARMLLRHGQAGILQELAAGVERGQVELAGGALGHALLPRLPRSEIERQIRLGHEAMAERMGRSWRPQGLLPPALAWSRQVGEVVANRGMRWVIADELALGRIGLAPRQRVAVLRGKPELHLYFRDRATSRAVASGDAAPLGDEGGGYRVAVVPGAAFTAGSAAFAQLERLVRGQGPILSTLTALSSAFPDREPHEPLPSSWRTTPDELAAGIPFAAWSAPDNELQALLWRLVGLGLAEAERLARVAGDDPACTRMRALLDEGLHTAPFRFASGRPWWEPAEVRAAAARLGKAFEGSVELVDPAVRAEAQAIQGRLDAALEAWERHRSADRLRSEPLPSGPAIPELAG